MTDRIAGTLLMGLDVAVEFATLGEFRLVEPELVSAQPEANPAPLVRRPERRAAATDTDRRLLPRPSTALGRASLPPEPRRMEIPRVANPAKGIVPSSRRRRPAPPVRPVAHAAPRKRAGAVEPGAQLCLFGR